MNLNCAKDKFIMEWGTLCGNWGVNRAMGQIHALLLVSANELCADQIMEELKISRGNTNMNLRALMDWRLIEKIHKPGCRKDYFKAEKDMNKVFRIIVENRKKKEFDPLVELLDELKTVEPNCAKSDEFCRVMNSMNVYTHKVDRALSALTNSNFDWISKIFMR
jgi:DNA-binding transcriptional regulator GbsR (MarR family)